MRVEGYIWTVDSCELSGLRLVLGAERVTMRKAALRHQAFTNHERIQNRWPLNWTAVEFLLHHYRGFHGELGLDR